MCDDTTTKLCNNLQSIAIATTNNPEFDEWIKDVSVALTCKSAIALYGDDTLQNIYHDGVHPRWIAAILDKIFIGEIK